MTRTMTTRRAEPDVITVPEATRAGRPRIRWGAVFAGMVTAVALLLLLASLWLALGYASDVTFVVDQMEWFLAGSAAGCLFIGGLMAGRLSGVRGVWAGIAHGLTLWAVASILALSVGIPSVINVLNLGRVTTEIDARSSLLAAGVDRSLWATFLAIVAALVTAAVGGAIGGASLRKRRSADPGSGFASSRTERLIDEPGENERI
jgi:hypothetical protein